MSDPLLRLTAALADRYRLERQLGAGGMALVYLAEDLKHHRKVAVKVLRPELAASLGPERFLREIEIAAGLHHPHILPLYDSGDADGLLYYVMPLVEGESLRDRLTREKQLPLDEALRIALEAADALSYAHSRGVIHRDIKPENVLLESGHAVVADFGIARAITAAGGTQLTQTGIAVGTPAYMSPEQASGERDLDGRSDIYALGCVLYEMLAGEPPFTGPTPQAIVARALTETPRPLQVVRETVPAAIEAGISKAMARTPADRFATAAQFAEALSRASTGELAAPRAPVLRRARTRRAVTVLAAGAVVALAGAAWVLGRGSGAEDAPAARPRRLAVLPLANLGGDSAQAYLAAGLTDGLITTLAQVAAFDVISGTSVMSYQRGDKSAEQIARELGVELVIEGSVQRADPRVHLSVRLIDGKSGAVIWTRSYHRELRGVLTLQHDVAGDVASQAHARLTAAERRRLAAARSVNAEAHEATLRGRYHLETRTPEGIQTALDWFRQALAADPTHAPAYAGLADYYSLLPFYTNTPPGEAFAKARAAAVKALQLDESLGRAHASLAYVRAYAAWDWAGAEQEYRRALELNPDDADVHHAYSRLLAALGRLPEAEAEARRAYELDPLSLVAHANLGVIAFFGRQWDQAIRHMNATLELDRDFSTAHWGLGLVYEQQRRYQDAAAQFERAMAIAGRGTNALASLGHLYGVSGRRADAEAVLRELLERAQTRRLYSYQVALVYAGLGRRDDAFKWLERAYDERATLLSYLKMDPRFDALRDDARFEALLRRMHLAG